MDKKKMAFTKTNYILVAIGMAIIIIGLLLMTGPNCTNEYFEPDIFSVRRIKVPSPCKVSWSINWSICNLFSLSI